MVAALAGADSTTPNTRAANPRIQNLVGIIGSVLGGKARVCACGRIV